MNREERDRLINGISVFMHAVNGKEIKEKYHQKLMSYPINRLQLIFDKWKKLYYAEVNK